MTGTSPLSEEQTRRVLSVARDLAREDRADELGEFLDHGVPVDVQDREGNTLLMLAAYRGNVATVRMLLERGADANVLNDRGQSPLAGALFKGEADTVRLLVNAGADLDRGTPTPRATAAMFGQQHLLG